MPREVHSGMEHEVGSGRVVRVEVQLRGGGQIPASRTSRPINAIIGIVLVRILRDIVSGKMPLLTNIVIELDAREVLVFVIRLQIWVVVGELAGGRPRWSGHIGKSLLCDRIPCGGRADKVVGEG